MGKKIIWMAFVAIASVSMTGCNKVEEKEQVSNEPGTLMVFGASTSWQNEPRTRTEYSGKDERDRDISKDSGYERIDWVESSDRIRILCDAAVGKANPSDKMADYIITDVSTGTDKKKSVAGIVPADDNSLHWGTDEHVIYALYPAPGMESNYDFTTNKTVSAANSRIESVTGNKARITGLVPASQEVVKVDNIFKPNMNFAYMYAATTATPGVPGSVLLSFNPLVSAFEFSLKALDDVMAGNDLLSLKLSTTGSSYLSGSFKADLDYGGETPVSIATTSTVTPGREITVTFPTGTRLSKTDYSVVTVLALGLSHTSLTLTLTFADNVKRSIALNTQVDGVSTPVTLGACKKAYFKLGVPSDTYVLGTLTPVTVTYEGVTSANLATGFVSYKKQGENRVPVKFKLEFSEANADGSCKGVWTYTPDWVTLDSGNNYDGSASGQVLRTGIPMSPNEMDPLYEKDEHTKRLYDATPKTSRFDLARVNVATGETIDRTTANCYVVQASGHYRFPVAYGNSVQNGVITNTKPRFAYGLGWGEDGQDELTYLDSNDGNTYYSKGHYLGRFRDHLDHKINTSYLSGQFPDATFDAKLLWTDEEGLVTNVSYQVNASNRNNDYIYFDVPRETIRQGNALIAVTVNGVIAWSWHIWVTDRDLTKSVTGPVSTDDDGIAYTFSPFNLGWCDPITTKKHLERKCYVRAVQVDDSDEPLTGGQVSEPVLVWQKPYILSFGANNPYYQWGRKDPLMATNGNGNRIKTYYDPDGNGCLPIYEDVWSAPVTHTIGYAIQHPNIAIYDSATASTETVHDADANWCNPGNRPAMEDDPHTFPYNLWNYMVATRGFKAEASYQTVGKTIYDPSPVGYKMAPLSAFSGFTRENFPVAEDGLGRIYNGTLYFPCMGTLGNPRTPSGAVTEVIHGSIGSLARYWSASPDGPSNNYRGLSLRFTTDTNNELIVHNNNYRSTGQPVRPIVDPPSEWAL